MMTLQPHAEGDKPKVWWTRTVDEKSDQKKEEGGKEARPPGRTGKPHLSVASWKGWRRI